MSSSSVTTSDGTVTVVQNDDVPTPPALPATGHTGQGSFTVGVHSDQPLTAHVCSGRKQGSDISVFAS